MMKKIFLLLVFILLTVSAAYAGDLEEITDAGVLRFGVSPDNYPFVFYDRNDDLTGIDIGLMEEIADRMGVTLEVSDMSADSLEDSLVIGQTDVIGGAFSKTTGRKDLIDFTRIYYSTGAVFLSGPDFEISGMLSADSFSGLKIGVRKGSGFEEWLKSDFLEKGSIQEKDIYTFANIDDAVRALNKRKVDLVMMDANVYLARLQSDPDYVSWQYGSAEDNYAFGIRKNSDLKTVINDHLKELLSDGTAQAIADSFFNASYQNEQAMTGWQPWTATPLPTPIPAASPTPLPTVLPTAAVTARDQCSNYSMTYVTDVTIPDGQQISAGNAFTKTWRIKNTGSCTWTTDFTFAFVSGNQMGGQTQHLPRTVFPGETVDISVPMVAPAVGGSYQSDWQLKTPQGYGIGTPIWVRITVPGGYSAPTAVSYPTAIPYYGPVQQAVKPELLWYYPNFYAQEAGKCVNVYWGVTGNSTAELFVDGVSVYFGSEEQYQIQLCSQVQTPGTHYIKLCAYGSGDDLCETLIYTAY